MNARLAVLFLLVAGLRGLDAQPSARPAPFASLALGVGATSLWWQSMGAAVHHEGQADDNRPSVTAGALAGVALGRSARVAAVADVIWLAAQGDSPELAALAGLHLEYIFPPGGYTLFGEAGLCWHVTDPWDSSREAGRGAGFAVGAGYRLTRVFSLEAKCSFSAYDAETDGDLGYRHISLLAALRAILE